MFLMTAISEILDLPVDDRLACMESLWSSLLTEEITSPTWHQEVLDSRKAALDEGKAKLITVEELEIRLEKVRK